MKDCKIQRPSSLIRARDDDVIDAGVDER